MGRHHAVHVRQDGTHAARPGLEAGKAQQRIEPDDAVREARQPRHLRVEQVDVLVVQPVGHQQYGGAAGQCAASPAPVELGQRRADARAAGPVRHQLRDGLHGHVRIALAQLPRHVGQARAEQEGLDALARLHQRVAVVQHRARVAAHRSGDVEQQHQRRRAVDRLAIFPGGPFAAGPYGLARGGPQIGVAPARGCLQPPRTLLRQVRAPVPDHVLQRAPFAGIERIEITRAQRLVRREGERRADVVALARGCRARRQAGRGPGAQGIRQPVAALHRYAAVYARQQQGAQFAFPVGVAPEQVEGGIEQDALVGVCHQQRGQGGPHIVAAADVDMAERLDGVHRARWRERHAGAAQQPHEMRHVAGEHRRGRRGIHRVIPARPARPAVVR